jgi:hypothetical protein
MRHNFNLSKKSSLSKGLLFCLLLFAFGNISVALGESPRTVANENKTNQNLFANSFNLFTGCNTALNLLGGTPYYDNDCKTDISIWRPGTTGQFWIWNSGQNNSTVASFGTTGDIPLGGDYDGDGITDFAVYRIVNDQGHWLIYSSSNSVTSDILLGTSPYDFPVPADYDGNGKSDAAIFRMEIVKVNNQNVIRPTFYYWRLLNSQYSIQEITLADQPITSSDLIPVVNNYDSDAIADVAIWNRTSGQWNIKYSGGQYPNPATFGLAGDITVPGKFKNSFPDNNSADLAVWRPSTATWWVYHTNNGEYQTVQFGLVGDEPVPGDYDGDGFLDFAIRRPSNNSFHILGSSVGYFVFPFGLSGDIPIAAPKYPLTSLTPLPLAMAQCPNGNCKEYVCPKYCGVRSFP